MAADITPQLTPACIKA